MFRKIYNTHKRVIAFLVLMSFLLSCIGFPTPSRAQEIPLPVPGTMVHLSQAFTPAHLVGMTIHPENALHFDFLINRGDERLSRAAKTEEYKKLVKYFLASLAIPDQDQWVNLSPYVKNRIIQDNFGKTEMGRDLLGQDYVLKQITSSLIYPEDNLGKKFWDKVYARAWKEYGTTNIPVNTFNKVWIIPDEAVIYESGNTAYVLRNHLKVMLEEDYLSLSKHIVIPAKAGIQNKNDIHSIGSQIVRQIILPELEKEVNEGKNFANLRQIYSGMILATWYKKALKASLLGQIYADKAKTKGVNQSNPKANEEIYQRYLQAFKKGVFNFIKEDVDRYIHETIPRRYFSGGMVDFASVSHDVTTGFKDAAVLVVRNNDFVLLSPQVRAKLIDSTQFKNNDTDNVSVGLNITQDMAMDSQEETFIATVNMLMGVLKTGKGKKKIHNALSEFKESDGYLEDSREIDTFYENLNSPVFAEVIELLKNYIKKINRGFLLGEYFTNSDSVLTRLMERGKKESLVHEISQRNVETDRLISGWKQEIKDVQSSPTPVLRTLALFVYWKRRAYPTDFPYDPQDFDIVMHNRTVTFRLAALADVFDEGNYDEWGTRVMIAELENALNQNLSPNPSSIDDVMRQQNLGEPAEEDERDGTASCLKNILRKVRNDTEMLSSFIDLLKEYYQFKFKARTDEAMTTQTDADHAMKASAWIPISGTAAAVAMAVGGYYMGFDPMWTYGFSGMAFVSSWTSHVVSKERLDLKANQYYLHPGDGQSVLINAGPNNEPLENPKREYGLNFIGPLEALKYINELEGNSKSQVFVSSKLWRKNRFTDDVLIPIPSDENQSIWEDSLRRMVRKGWAVRRGNQKFKLTDRVLDKDEEANMKKQLDHDVYGYLSSYIKFKRNAQQMNLKEINDNISLKSDTRRIRVLMWALLAAILPAIDGIKNGPILIQDAITFNKLRQDGEQLKQARKDTDPRLDALQTDRKDIASLLNQLELRPNDKILTFFLNRYLEASLGDPDPKVRFSTIMQIKKALNRKRSEALQAFLRPLVSKTLDDADPGIQQESTDAFMEMQDTKDIESLIDIFLKTKNVNVRKYISNIFIKANDHRVVEPMIKAVVEERDRSAASVLCEIKDKRIGKALLKVYLETKDDKIRSLVSIVLEYQKDPDTLGPLLNALRERIIDLKKKKEEQKRSGSMWAETITDNISPSLGQIIITIRQMGEINAVEPLIEDLNINDKSDFGIDLNIAIALEVMADIPGISERILSHSPGSREEAIEQIRAKIQRMKSSPSSNKEMQSQLQEHSENTHQSAPDAAMKGGIDFNAVNLHLQIKRDGHGVPLPLGQQDMAQLNTIEGFVPEILDIQPAAGLAIFSELKQRLQG